MSDETMRALLVEDNLGDVGLVREALREAHGLDVELVHVTRLDQALRRLEASPADVVLLDLSLPDAQGLETLTWAHAAAPDVPIVVLTGLSDEAVAVQAVRCGAQDYLVKGQLEGGSLVRCMRYAIERQRMLSELERMRRQQLELKDRLLSHVSHELRTPLNAVYGFVTILLDGLAGNVSVQQRECLEIALTNVQQLRTMIGDLLDATRAETGNLLIEPRRMSIAELIDDTVSTLKTAAEAKSVSLSAKLPPEIPDVFADPQRVRQILTNLVDNGIKFTAPAGAVSIMAGPQNGGSTMVRVTVTDTGCGIGPEAMGRVFERLYQEANPSDASRRGLGLGLYICKALVVRQGGDIWVESRPNAGSKFSFTLPVFSPADHRNT